MTDAGAQTAKPTAPKRKLRNYLLKAAFQLKYTFVLIIACAIVAFIFGYFVLSEAHKLHESNGQVIERIHENTNMLLADARGNPDLKDADLKAFEKKIKATDEEQVGRVHAIDEGVSRIIYILAAVMAGLVVFLMFFGIFITHRVAGPIYVMTVNFKKIAAGDLSPLKRELRKGDELRDFYDAYKGMLTALNEREERIHLAVDTALGAATEQGRAAGLSEEAIAVVKAPIERLRGDSDGPAGA